MKKRSFLLIIPFILILLLSGTVTAEEIFTSETQVYLNPVYQDVFTEQDVIDNWRAPLLRMAPGSSSEPATSWEELAVLLRQQLTAFSPSITLYIYSDLDYLTEGKEVFFSKMVDAYDMAAMHTGVPNEGDYIRWNNMGYSYSFRRQSSGISDFDYKYELNYKFTYLHSSSQETATTNALNRAYDSLSFSDHTSYAKTLAIYNYVIDHVEYDYANLNDTSYTLKHSTYAAAVNHIAVCQGYATMMYRLLLMAGVDNRVVTSNTHAWNIVQVAGDYYQVDATWGDSSNQSTRNRYFLKKNGAWTDVNHQFEERYLTDEFTSGFPISSGDYVHIPITAAEITDSSGFIYDDTIDFGLASGSTVLYASVLPATYARDIIWSTPDTDIVTLVPADDGLSCLVEYLQTGTAAITMQTLHPEWSDTVEMNIVIKTEDFTVLDGSDQPASASMALDISETSSFILSGTASPAEALQSFAWESSDPAVARVSSARGTSTEVILRSIGECVITASTIDGTDLSQEIHLTISGDNGNLGVTSITVHAPETVTVGTTGTVSAEILPENAANKAVEWSVSVNGRSTPLASVRNGILTINRNMPVRSVLTITAAAMDGSGVTGSANVTAGPKADKVMITNGSGEPLTGTQTVVRNGSGEYRLYAAVIPEDASKEVNWKSGSPSTASVDEEGRVTFLKNGTVTITASAKDGSGKSASIKLTGVTHVESIQLSGPEKIAVGKSGTLTASVLPAEAGNKKLKWSVSIDGQSTKLASVSAGKVTINKKLPAGTFLTVKAEAADGSGIYGTKEIYASPIPQSIRILDSENNVVSGTIAVSRNISDTWSFSAEAVYDGEGEVGQEFTWKSGSPKIATVDNGTVIFLKNGTAAITATAKDGSGKSATVRLTGVTYVESIQLSGPGKIAVGKTGTVTASVLPAGAGNKKLKWSVSIDGQSTKLASVSAGKVRLSKNLPAGTVLTVKAEAMDGSGVISTFDISTAPVPQSVRILDSAGNAVSGTVILPRNVSNTWTFSAEAVYDGEGEADQEFTWKSGSPKIAAVDNGTVTFLKNGTVSITATTKDGSGKSAAIKLTGVTYVEEITLSAPENILPGKSAAVSVLVSPADASNKNVIWTVLLNREPSKLAYISKGKLVINKNVPAGSIVTLTAKAADNYLSDGAYVTAEKTVTVGAAASPSSAQEISALTEAFPSEAEPPEELPVSDEESAAEETSEAELSAEPEGSEVPAEPVSADPVLLEAAPGESIDLTALIQSDSEPVWAASGAEDGTVTIENGTARISPDAEAGTEIILMGVSMTDPDTIYRFTIRITQNSAAETSEISDAAIEQDESSAEPAEDPTDSGLPAVSFDAGELVLTVGEKRQLLHGSDDAMLFGSNNNGIVSLDPETMIITAETAGDTMLYAASIDPMEVKALLHVTVTAAEPAEMPEELPAETTEEAAEAEDTELPQAETEIPAAETTEETEEEIPEIPVNETEPAMDEDPVFPVASDGIPTEEPVTESPAETAVPAEPGLTEIRIEDIDENGISAFEGSALTIERRRLSAGDDELTALIFKIENEAIARLTERSAEEMLEKGIEINMLTSGETLLLIGHEGEEPLLRVRILVNAMPQDTDSVTEEGAALPAEPVPEIPLEEESLPASEEAVSEPVYDPIPEPEADASAEAEPEEVPEAPAPEPEIPAAGPDENTDAGEPEAGLPASDEG